MARRGALQALSHATPRLDRLRRHSGLSRRIVARNYIVYGRGRYAARRAARCAPQNLHLTRFAVWPIACCRRIETTRNVSYVITTLIKSHCTVDETEFLVTNTTGDNVFQFGAITIAFGIFMFCIAFHLLTMLACALDRLGPVARPHCRVRRHWPRCIAMHEPSVDHLR